MAIKQKTKSLSVRDTDLSDSFVQLQVLNGQNKVSASFPSFAKKINDLGYAPFKPQPIEIFQLNIGKLCNQTCAHCHVDAGPDKTKEQMTKENLQICIDIIRENKIPKVDITGGAPEMNAHFRWFVEECAMLGCEVMNRCNLTILRANPKYYDLPEFFKANKVHVISYLPYFSKKRKESQRGDGVFEDSIEELQMLNEEGYGKEGRVILSDLEYNR